MRNSIHPCRAFWKIIRTQCIFLLILENYCYRFAIISLIFSGFIYLLINMIANGQAIPVTIVKRPSHYRNKTNISRLGKAEVCIGILSLATSLLSYIARDQWLDYVIFRLLSSALIISSGSVAISLRSNHDRMALRTTNLGLPIVTAIISIASCGISAADAFLASSNSPSTKFQLVLQALLAVYGAAGAVTSIMHASFFCGECCCSAEYEHCDQTFSLDLNQLRTVDGQCPFSVAPSNVQPPQHAAYGTPVLYTTHPIMSKAKTLPECQLQVYGRLNWKHDAGAGIFA